MVRFVIYADREEDSRALIPLLRDATRKRGKWALIQPFIGAQELPRYLTFVRRNPYLVMVVAASGTHGREVAVKIRQNNRAARMLWFSDRENGAESYRIHVDCFGLLPPTAESVALALDTCGISTVKPQGEEYLTRQSVPQEETSNKSKVDQN
ncbi:MAG: hypothetical protein LUG44_05850 [Clostridiales bacterium]|nr:hypothetical protein [Clostridiales bacterium]